jgi:transcription elongation GreA/GreB family factor
MDLTFKITVHNTCVSIVAEKIHELQSALSELSDGAQNDAKSSAGDKHETARAMMQIEQDRIARQLADAMTLRHVLERIQPERSCDTAIAGSLLKTDKGYFYLTAAIGKVDINGLAVMAISAQSPLGVKLLGLKAGDSTTVNTRSFTIEAIA